MKTWMFIISAASVLLVACQETPAPEERATVAAPVKQAPELAETFLGYVEPLSATKLRAPRNSFRILGWNSDSSWIKLKRIPKDGKKVKKGEVLGHFEFNGKEAKPRVEEQIRRAEARMERTGVQHREELSKMRTNERKKKLDASRAELDTRKKGVISERDLAQFQLSHKLAAFDADASNQQVGAYRRASSAEAKYLGEEVGKAHNQMKRYERYEEMFRVRAPHDGVVRHAFNSRRGRKIQNGDGMPSGMHFVSLARDETLTVRFFVPEHRYQLLRSHDVFLIHSPSSDEKFEVTVDRVEEFPQELGFLKEDNDIPAAREKMYVVHASFKEQPEELSSGLEVKVSLP